MSRTIKTVTRPPEHVYADDPDESEDFFHRLPCGWVAPASQRKCGLFEDNSVHVTPEELAELAAKRLPPVPAEDRSKQILGEG